MIGPAGWYSASSLDLARRPEGYCPGRHAVVIRDDRAVCLFCPWSLPTPIYRQIDWRGENESDPRLVARIERLQRAYLELEVAALPDFADEHCINHPKEDSDEVLETMRQTYRADLQPGDLPDE